MGNTNCNHCNQTGTVSREYETEKEVRFEARQLEGIEIEGLVAFRVENNINAPSAGLAFRRSKQLEDTAVPELVAEWGNHVYGIDEGDGWIRTVDGYLPIWILGREVVKTDRGLTPFIVENNINAPSPGLAYRRSKNLEDIVDPGFLATWGSRIYGLDEGDGWVKTMDGYLPRFILGFEVIKQQGQSEAGSRPERQNSRLDPSNDALQSPPANPVIVEDNAVKEEDTAVKEQPQTKEQEAPSLWSGLFGTNSQKSDTNEVPVKKAVQPSNEKKEELPKKEPPKSVSAIAPGELSPEAEKRAQVIASKLSGDLGQDILDSCAEESGQLPLSKDRVKLLLERTEGFRMTCKQLDSLVRMVTLDAHKEQLISLRYAHLTDKENFRETVVAQFSLSKSMRDNLTKKLTKTLTEDKLQ